MADRPGEAGFYNAAWSALRTWLASTRRKVMATYSQFHITPNPAGVLEMQGAWNDAVDHVVADLEPTAEAGWREVADLPYNRTAPAVQGALQTSRNLVVGLPDEVYQQVVAELLAGTNRGEDVDQLAGRVDALLTDEHYWQGRARKIAVTETNRAFNAGRFGAAQALENARGTVLAKEWVTSHDERVRQTHRDADGQFKPLSQPFEVGDALLMFPSDPFGAPEEVINCRCDMKIQEAVDVP